MWFIFAIICAFLYALKGLIVKKTSIYKIDPFTLVYLPSIVSLFFLLVLNINNIEVPSFIFLKYLFVGIILNAFAFTFLMKAISISEISIVYPILSTTPAFMILTSFLILGEQPDKSGIIGIILITIGVYLLGIQKNIKNVFEPLKSIFKDKGAFLALIVSLIWSVAANVDKLCLLKSNVLFYPFIFKLFFCILYLPVFLKFRNKHIKISFSSRIFFYLFCIGLIEVFMIISQFKALVLTNASYVVAIKRSGMFFSVILGFFFLKEKKVLEKFISCIIIFIGMWLIAQ